MAASWTGRRQVDLLASFKYLVSYIGAAFTGFYMVERHGLALVYPVLLFHASIRFLLCLPKVERQQDGCTRHTSVRDILLQYYLLHVRVRCGITTN